jgi:hypothetical protein
VILQAAPTVEPARKRERVAASLRDDPLSRALVEWPFVPILPRIVLLDRAQAPSARRLG